MGAGGDAGDSL